VLGVVAIGIAWEYVPRLLAPQSVAFGQATVVAVIGLAVNLLSALLLGGGHAHGHSHHHHGHERHSHHEHGHEHHHAAHGHGDGGRRHQDNNLRAAFVHVRADALTSVLAIAALLAGRFLGGT
jgi:Co/Zn/Cd efflux system component